MSKVQVNYPDPGFFTGTSLIQLGYGILVNLSMVTSGLAYGFSAVTIPQLTSPDSSIKVTVTDESWIASVLPLFCPIGSILCGYLIDKLGRRTMLICSQVPVCFGWLYTGFAGSAKDIIIASVLPLFCPIGSILCGYLIDKLGRRTMLICSQVPVCFGWLYTGFAGSAKDIIIGRMITGFGVGMVVSVPRVYMTEVSLPNMRGLIGAFPNIAISIGITVQATLGSLLKWNMLCYIGCLYAVCLFMFNFCVPETPYFLLQNTSLEDAKASLKKFRSKKYNIDAEMEELLDFKNENDIHKLSFKEQIMALFRRGSCRPFWLMAAYVLIAELSGASIILMWSVDILEKSKSSVSSEIGNVILGATRIAMGVCTAFLIFNMRRRPLALLSAFGVGAVCIALGLFIRYKTQKSINPQICYITYIIFATPVYYTLPILIMFELYPLQVRGLLGGISISNINLLIFGANYSYPYVRDFLGFANTIIGFGICSIAGCIFLYFFLPETKDLTLQEIEEYYNDLRPTLTSQRRLVSMQNVGSSLTRNPSSSRSLMRISDKHKKDATRTKVNKSDSDEKDDKVSKDVPKPDKTETEE